MDEVDSPGQEVIDIFREPFDPISPTKADIQAAIDQGVVNARRAVLFLRSYHRN